MQTHHHPLCSDSLGQQFSLVSLHFGAQLTGPKTYIQASLHADELPGMLVAHHLKGLLAQAEQDGHLKGPVVLVPVANPLGLAQRVWHKGLGRFDLATAENFNRHYPDLTQAVTETVWQSLSPDAAHNVQLLRQAAGRYLTDLPCQTTLEDLRRTLLLLSHDADFVLDLHCDFEAVMHLYTEEPCWPAIEPLARYMACETILLAKQSGGHPFDECLSGWWWQLQAQAAARGVTHPIVQACASTTLELRGERDVTHAQAQKDAQALMRFLSLPSAEPPVLQTQPTPLAGTEILRAHSAGILVYLKEVGATVNPGDVVAEIINPLSGEIESVHATVQGCFFARNRERYARAGDELGKIAGAQAFRTGSLLSA